MTTLGSCRDIVGVISDVVRISSKATWLSVVMKVKQSARKRRVVIRLGRRKCVFFLKIKNKKSNACIP